jgi:diacylglycerol O-acyltransferase
MTRLATHMIQRLPQRSVNTVTTNVPGPLFSLLCVGRQMLDYYPYVPIMHGVRIGTAILSYNGQLFFGVTGDYDNAPDVGGLATAIAAGVTELRERALRFGIQPDALAKRSGRGN